jgi:hypothetical protein
MSPISLQSNRMATTALVPVDLGDPVARHLVSGHDQNRLGTGRLLLGLGSGELKPMSGHVRGQVAKSRGGRVVAGGVAVVGGLAPDA